MIWQDPAYLWLLMVVPLLVGGVWAWRRYLRNKRRQYFDDSLFQNLKKRNWLVGSRIRQISLYIGIAFLTVALAGPKIGTEVREVKRQGVDLLVALDLSSSMNAEDVKPSRLEKAKYEINRLIDRLKGDRVGLIVFTGDAYLQSPMTLDYSALRMFLDIADSDMMPSTTTHFASALQTAHEAFQAKEVRESDAAKVLLIVSDGENQGEPYDSELKQLTGEQVSVYTVGLGSQSGAQIPIYDEDTGALKGYKRDESGKIVTTRIHPEVLKDLADKGNGRYYEIGAGNEGIDAFLGRLDELQQGEFASQEYADYKNQYAWLAGIGLLMLVVAMVTPDALREDRGQQTADRG